MIDQSFTLVEYLWRLVHKITHRIWHWLSLSKIGRIFFLGLHPLFQLMEGHQNLLPHSDSPYMSDPASIGHLLS